MIEGIIRGRVRHEVTWKGVVLENLEYLGVYVDLAKSRK